MRATFMFGAGDVRVIDVPDPALQQSTDAIVRVVRACICGSDLHPYHSMPADENGTPMGHEFLGATDVVAERGAEGIAKVRELTGGPAPVRHYIEELLPDVLDGTIEPGKVFDRTVGIEQTPAGYRAMDDREALKVLLQF